MFILAAMTRAQGIAAGHCAVNAIRTIYFPEVLGGNARVTVTTTLHTGERP